MNLIKRKKKEESKKLTWHVAASCSICHEFITCVDNLGQNHVEFQAKVGVYHFEHEHLIPTNVKCYKCNTDIHTISDSYVHEANRYFHITCGLGK